MYALRSITRAIPQSNLVQATRNMTAISGPPKTRVSFTEKVIHGVVMTAAYCAIPAWVLVNIKNYRGKE